MSFASGKIILIGEHAVVHGQPAIAAAIARGVKVQVKTHTHDLLQIQPWNLSFTADETQPTGKAFKTLLDLFDKSERPPLCVQATVELAGGAGLGCSAALGVAIVSGINDFLACQHSKEWINEQSIRWEKVFHGNPSGIDNYMATFGGIAKYQKDTDVKPLHFPDGLHFVIAFSGQPSSTKRMIARVEQMLIQQSDFTQKVLSEIGQLSETATQAIEEGNLETLGRCMNQNHALLKSLGVSTPTLDEMCEVSRQAQAWGAKLTGGGGGGCMVALCKHSQHAKEIVQILKKFDPQAFQVQVQ